MSDKRTARIRYMTDQDGMCTFRIRIPDALHALYGKKEHWQSTGIPSSGDRLKAGAICAKRAAEWKAQFRRDLAKPATERTAEEIARIRASVRATAEAMKDDAGRLPLDLAGYLDAAVRAGVQAELARMRSQLPEAQRRVIEAQGGAGGYLDSLHTAKLAVAVAEEAATLQPTGDVLRQFGPDAPQAMDDAEAARASLPALQRQYAALAAPAAALGIVPPTEAGTDPLAITAATESFLEANKRSRSAEAAEKIRTRVRGFVKQCGDVSFADFQAMRAAMRGYLDWRLDNGCAVPTVHKDAMTFRQIADWLVADKKITDNPVAGLKRAIGKDPREKSELRHAFTAEQVGQLVAGMAQHWRKSPDWTAAVMLTIATGARIGEILQLTPDDVRDNSECAGYTVRITREGTKTTKNTASVREIPIHSAVLQHVLEAQQRNAGKPLLFAKVAGKDKAARVRAVGRNLTYLMEKQCGIPDPDNLLSTHSFRHWITALAEARAPGASAPRMTAVELDTYLGHALKAGYSSKPDCAALRPLVESLPVLGATVEIVPTGAPAQPGKPPPATPVLVQ